MLHPDSLTKYMGKRGALDNALRALDTAGCGCITLVLQAIAGGEKGAGAGGK